VPSAWPRQKALGPFMRFHRALLERHRQLRRELTILRRRNAMLEIYAVRDPLTGLYNRRSFIERMLTRAATMSEERRGVPPLHSPDAVMMLDIDHFKAVNDTYGHRAGDAILVEVAQRIVGAVRECDIVMRWGGEEFLVFAPNVRLEQATRLVERIMAAVAGCPIEFDGGSVAVTVSAGIAPLPFAGLPESRFSWERTVSLADGCLYLAKRAGRNCSIGIVNPPALDDKSVGRIEHDLGAAAAVGLVDLITTPGPCP